MDPVHDARQLDALIGGEVVLQGQETAEEAIALVRDLHARWKAAQYAASSWR